MRSPRKAQVLAVVLSVLLLAGPVALAQAQSQSDPEQFTRILPASTVFALFAQPGTSGTQVLDSLVAELDLDSAKATMHKLAAVLGAAADDFGLDFDPSEMDEFGGMLLDSMPDCPALAVAVEGIEPEAVTGRLAVGASVTTYAPMPALMVIARPDDVELGARLFEAITSCYDSGVAMSEGETPFYVLGDGGDFPVVVAQVDGTFLLSSNPDVLRGMVRRATGANEPSFAGTRVGGMTRGLTSRGLAFTLNLAGIADLVANFAPMLGGEPEMTRLAERAIATLRAINGVAASVNLDDAGLVLDSVVTVDLEAAEAAGEHELLDLLNCAGCVGAEPSLIPTGVASLSRTSYPLTAAVAWIDSWLADVAAVVAVENPDALPSGELSVAGLVDEYLGLDLGELVTDWLGTTTHVAQVGVYDTDLRSWVQGPGTIVAIPVSSETAAREGLALWDVALDRAAPLFAKFAEIMESDLGDGAMLPAMSLDNLLSRREVSYRGVTYDRLRSPFSGDYGYAVFGGHLVVAQPSRTIESAIDVYLGGPSVLDDPAFGPLLATQPPAPAGFEIIDLPRYLTGLAAISDLAAKPIASMLFFAVQAAWAESLDGADSMDGSTAGGDALDAAEVPTFDDLIGLADLVTEGLLLLADRTGVAIGSTEVIDGAHWSTLRVPFR